MLLLPVMSLADTCLDDLASRHADSLWSSKRHENSDHIFEDCWCFHRESRSGRKYPSSSCSPWKQKYTVWCLVHFTLRLRVFFLPFLFLKGFIKNHSVNITFNYSFIHTCTQPKLYTYSYNTQPKLHNNIKRKTYWYWYNYIPTINTRISWFK